MRQYALLLVALILVSIVIPRASAQPSVTITSVDYPKKVEPNAQFSIMTSVASSDVNGWASVKLYSNGQQLQAPSGVWYGTFGAAAGSSVNVSFSGVTLGPSVEPYNLTVAAFWTPFGGNEVNEDAKSFAITVITLILAADCLPPSVNASENSRLTCSLSNHGNDVAYDVGVSITNHGDFSPLSGLHETIGDMSVGAIRQVYFNLSAPIVFYASDHSLTLQIDYHDSFGAPGSVSVPVSIMVDLTPWSSFNGALSYAPWVILGVVVIALIFFAIVGRRIVVTRRSVSINK